MSINKLIKWGLAGLGVYALLIWLIWSWWQGEATLNPIVWQFGQIQIYWYGLCLSLALLIGFGVVWAINRSNRQFSDDDLLNLVILAVLGGILGARLMFVALKLPWYLDHPLEILNLHNGGMSIHGGILGGGLVTWLYLKAKGLSWLGGFDLLATGLILAQAVGRFGNFFNHEAFGGPTNLPWKMFVPSFARPDRFIDTDFFHPTFIYESVLDFGLFLILLCLPQKAGYRITAYLFGYSIIRFVMEFFRADSDMIGMLSIAQWVSLVLIVGVIVFWLVNRRRKCLWT